MGEGRLVHDDNLINQTVDYNGLLPYPLAPTDIDGLVDVKGMGYIIIEIKRGHTQMPFGQQLAIERMVQDFHKAGKHAVAVLIRHEEYDHTDVIFPAILPISAIYDGKRWRKPNRPCLAHEFIGTTIELWKGIEDNATPF